MKNNFLSEKLTYNGDERTATHVHLVSYNSAGMTVSDNAEIDASALSLDPASVSWVRVHGLKDTERIRALCAAFGIDFLVVQDILNVDHPSKVEEYERYNFVVAKYSCHGEMAHISLVQGENFVLSFSETETALFDGVQKAITDNVLKIRTRPTDYLLSVMINGLVADYASLASSIDDDMDDLASELIAAVDARDIGAQILSLRRRYMDLKRTVMPLKEQFSRLLRSDSRLIRKGTRPFLNDVNDHLLYVAQSIDSCRETLASLMDLYVSNNDLRMNDIMKRLTVVSTIFIPLTFLVGVWGMNFRNMPELEWKYGYATAWGVMIVIGVIVYLFFRTKKWR
ncbi:MAG TPA: magnesium/cobalt transporter CorA [Candidatus Alistipes excrementipullorum]|nr:magnesium/cobalt transporter CorA [Candidatus Alistipes excrementipullorum]